MPQDRVTGKQIAAGRILASISLDNLARTAKLPSARLRQIEATTGPVAGPESDAVHKALELFGVRFIPENGGGVGVRLKFTASEVRRIATLENEGGIAGDDDV
jgi:hypothetical protein